MDDFILNPNKILRNKILERIKINEGHCPCIKEFSNDTICPCKEFREKRICHCSLYVAKK